MSGGKHDIWIKDGFPPVPVPSHKGDIPIATAKKNIKSSRFGAKIMKYYYAIFNQNMDSVEAVSSELEGCVTFGEDWDEAIDNTIMSRSASRRLQK